MDTLLQPSKYRWADHLAADIARYYSVRFNRPFYAVVGPHEPFDIISVDQTIAVELKSESTTSRTGMIAVEYFNPQLNKCSGILSTSANLWCHVIYRDQCYTGYEIETKNLLRLIIENGITKTNYKNSVFKLLPVGLFTAHAEKIFTFKNDDGGKTVKRDIAGTLVPEQKQNIIELPVLNTAIERN